jgi:hypothetical protein
VSVRLPTPIEREIARLQGNVANIRASLREQHERHLRSQEVSAGDEWIAGTRLLGGQLREALAELRGAERIAAIFAEET